MMYQKFAEALYLCARMLVKLHQFAQVMLPCVKTWESMKSELVDHVCPFHMGIASFHYWLMGPHVVLASASDSHHEHCLESSLTLQACVRALFLYAQNLAILQTLVQGMRLCVKKGKSEKSKESRERGEHQLSGLPSSFHSEFVHVGLESFPGPGSWSHCAGEVTSLLVMVQTLVQAPSLFVYGQGAPKYMGQVMSRCEKNKVIAEALQLWLMFRCSFLKPWAHLPHDCRGPWPCPSGFFLNILCPAGQVHVALPHHGMYHQSLAMHQEFPLGGMMHGMGVDVSVP